MPTFFEELVKIVTKPQDGRAIADNCCAAGGSFSSLPSSFPPLALSPRRQSSQGLSILLLPSFISLLRRRPLLLNTSLLSSPSRECAINMRISCHFVFFPRRGCHLSVFQRKPIDRTNIRLRHQCLLFTLFKTWTATTTFLCIVLVCHFLDFLKVLFMFHDCSMDVIIAKRFSSSSIFIGKYIRAHMFV